ncbi:Maternal DNA replication licensing factor mcm3 [Anas platyrhynchos]|uniref:Maternal DNA replication licensing factor mcm3 n=1 Tax=Anas platyrhynchos TaxID=8839 RepID=R0L988_ANAPL|nr:Maternal DNA replication licensing factor mcm3 [Anas platyrhynchos]
MLCKLQHFRVRTGRKIPGTIMLANNIKLMSKEIAPTFSADDVAKIKKFCKAQTKGNEKVLNNGTRIKGDINILLLGVLREPTNSSDLGPLLPGCCAQPGAVPDPDDLSIPVPGMQLLCPDDLFIPVPGMQLLFQLAGPIYHPPGNLILLIPLMIFAFLILISPYAAIRTCKINGVKTTGQTLHHQ